MITYYWVMAYIAVASSFVPLWMYLSKRKRLPAEIHLIGWVVCLSILCDIAGITIIKLYHAPNHLINNTYGLLSFIIFSGFYYQILFRKHYRWTFITCSAVVLISFIIISMFVENFFKVHQTYAFVLSHVSLVVYAISYLEYLTVQMPVKNLRTHSLAWINAGILLYYAIAFFIFLMHKTNLQSEGYKVAIIMWGFHNLFRVFANILFAVGMYQAQERVVRSK